MSGRTIAYQKVAIHIFSKRAFAIEAVTWQVSLSVSVEYRVRTRHYMERFDLCHSQKINDRKEMASVCVVPLDDALGPAEATVSLVSVEMTP